MQSISPPPGSSRRVSRFLKPAIAIALLVAVVGTFAVVKQRGNKPAEDNKLPVTLEFAPADIAVVEQKALTRVLPFSGSLQPVVQSTVKSKVSGEVQQVLVREGQTVKQGQTIAQIDTADSKAKFDTQVAQMEEAKARWQIAAKNRDNNLALLKQNFISQNAYDTTQSTYEGIVATVKSNEAQVQIARKALQDAIIRSPISGIVAKKMVNVGEKVGPDSPVFSIVDLGNMEIEAPAPAMEIPSVKAGQAARFLVDGFGERPSKGRWSASTRSPSRARARSRCTSRLPTTTGAERRHVRQGIAGPRQVGVSAGGPAGADSRRDRQRCRFDGAHRLPVLACMAQHHHHRAHLAHRIH